MFFIFDVGIVDMGAGYNSNLPGKYFNVEKHVFTPIDHVQFFGRYHDVTYGGWFSAHDDNYNE